MSKKNNVSEVADEKSYERYLIALKVLGIESDQECKRFYLHFRRKGYGQRAAFQMAIRRSALRAKIDSDFKVFWAIMLSGVISILSTEIPQVDSNKVATVMTITMIVVVVVSIQQELVWSAIIGGYVLYLVLSAWAEEKIVKFNTAYLLKLYLAITILFAVSWLVK